MNGLRAAAIRETAMLHEGFDPELMRVHAQARACDLRGTMAEARRGVRLGRVRRWAGTRLIRLGTAIGAEPSLGLIIR